MPSTIEDNNARLDKLIEKMEDLNRRWDALERKENTHKKRKND